MKKLFLFLLALVASVTIQAMNGDGGPVKYSKEWHIGQMREAQGGAPQAVSLFDAKNEEAVDVGQQEGVVQEEKEGALLIPHAHPGVVAQEMIQCGNCTGSYRVSSSYCSHCGASNPEFQTKEKADSVNEDALTVLAFLLNDLESIKNLRKTNKFWKSIIDSVFKSSELLNAFFSLNDRALTLQALAQFAPVFAVTKWQNFTSRLDCAPLLNALMNENNIIDVLAFRNDNDSSIFHLAVKKNDAVLMKKIQELVFDKFKIMYDAIKRNDSVALQNGLNDIGGYPDLLIDKLGRVPSDEFQSINSLATLLQVENSYVDMRKEILKNRLLGEGFGVNISMVFLQAQASLLLCAVKCRSLACAEVLINAGSNLNIRESRADVLIKHVFVIHNTPLLFGFIVFSLWISKPALSFVSKGVLMLFESPVNFAALLWFRCSLALVLVGLIGVVYGLMTDPSINRPLLKALKKIDFCRQEAVGFILDQYFHQNQSKNKLDTVLEVAVRSDNIAMLRLLVQNGVIVNPLNEADRTPLDEAVALYGDSHEIVRILRSAGGVLHNHLARKSSCVIL